MFQHTAARRRLPAMAEDRLEQLEVSTHSRPKAAAIKVKIPSNYNPSFNTQPPEGGCFYTVAFWIVLNGFNTQPPEGGCRKNIFLLSAPSGFNTQPPEGGCVADFHTQNSLKRFQHTAARRRLRHLCHTKTNRDFVSTHSRPKAAAPYIKNQEKSAY